MAGMMGMNDSPEKAENSISAKIYLIIRSRVNSSVKYFRFILESHVVECSMVSFVHKD